MRWFVLARYFAMTQVAPRAYSPSRSGFAGDSQPLAAEAEQIEEEMRQVRAELREDVREIVTSAQIMGEWQYYVGRYPWLCVGLAAAAGFFIVPARPILVHPDAKALLELAKANKLEIKMESPSAKRGGIVAGLMGMLTATAVQGATAAANHFLQDLLKPASGPAHSREGTCP
jgi:hypothetical protein